MSTLTDYLQMFAKLNRASGAKWTGETLRRAPHKPILLLAVIDLVSRGVFSSPILSVTDDLFEANELFNGYWQRVTPVGHTSSIAFPFSRMASESFWKLLAVDGDYVNVTQANITTVPQLRRLAVAAQMDDELFVLMQDPEAREALRATLLQAHFSPEAQASLAEQIAINDQAYIYSRKLYEKAHQPLVKEAMEAEQPKAVARDQGFRRIVVTTYDHRCALCGLRIITPEGHTAVDAAHIKPWSISHNDDIRNGMALCKICHWAFDKGMVGISRDYNVMTSRQIGTNTNVPGVLQTLAGRGFLPPREKELWPSQEFLGWHRQKFRLNA